MMDNNKHTVVSACDHNFLWGALLLGISMRYQGMKTPYHVLGYDLSDEYIQMLQSIPGTRVFPTNRQDSRSICTQKPLAIATADTPIIVWMDADCVVSGNLEHLFVCPDNGIQIRERDRLENASVYRNYYGRKDKYGHIPNRVLQSWKADVDELEESRITYVYQTNCFVINRSHLPFVELWKKQMEKVIPPEVTGVYNPQSPAYFMTDESVINSLFAFSSQAPNTSEYLMDRDPEATCIHFGLQPKPWQGWTLDSFNAYGYIQNLISWAKENGIWLPPLPAAFQAQYMQREYRKAFLLSIYKELRYRLSTLFRSALRHFRD